MYLRKLAWVYILLLLTTTANAQNYKGIWYGYITKDGMSIPSGYALQVKQQNGNIITGRAYIYSEQFFLFQGMIDFIGTIKDNICEITELTIKSNEFPRPELSLCIKNLHLNLFREDNKDYLTGNWKSYSYKNWCEPGKVRLKRYMPEEANDSSIKQIPPEILQIIKADLSPKFSFLNTDLSTPIILDIAKPVFTLEVRDYLKEDRDTVSIYYNRNPVVKNLALKHRAQKYTIRIDKLSGLNEIIMYANNLGLVPPNTSSLTVDDGIRKQNVIISSSLQTSAVVYIRYEPLKAVP